MSDASRDLVITGCTAMVHGADESIEFLDDATIVVRDGVIESITADGSAPAAGGAERIDARGQVDMHQAPIGEGQHLAAQVALVMGEDHLWTR